MRARRQGIAEQLLDERECRRDLFLAYRRASKLVFQRLLFAGQSILLYGAILFRDSLRAGNC